MPKKPKEDVNALCVSQSLSDEIKTWMKSKKQLKNYEDIRYFLEMSVNATIAIDDETGKTFINKGDANSAVYQLQLLIMCLDRIRNYSDAGVGLTDRAREFAKSMTVEQAHRLMKEASQQAQVTMLNKFAEEHDRITTDQTIVTEVKEIEFNSKDPYQQKVSAIIADMKKKQFEDVDLKPLDADYEKTEDDDIAEF